MRLPIFCVPLLLTGFAAAHAETYSFSFTGSDAQLNGLGIPNSYSETFTIDTSMLIPPTAADGFICGSPADNCFITQSKGIFYTVYRNGAIAESSDIGLSPLATFSYFPDASQSSSLTLFTGSSTAPELVEGAFYAYYDSGVSYNPEGPVTITELNASAVPEPGTLVLLGTGALGLAGNLRRRLAWFGF